MSCELHHDGQVARKARGRETVSCERGFLPLCQAHLVQFHLHGDDKRLQRPLVPVKSSGHAARVLFFFLRLVLALGQHLSCPKRPRSFWEVQCVSELRGGVPKALSAPEAWQTIGFRYEALRRSSH